MGTADDLVGRILNHAGAHYVTRRHYNHAQRFEEVRQVLDDWSRTLKRIVGVTAAAPLHPEFQDTSRSPDALVA
jgi:hypothetical protein